MAARKGAQTYSELEDTDKEDFYELIEEIPSGSASAVSDAESDDELFDIAAMKIDILPTASNDITNNDNFDSEDELPLNQLPVSNNKRVSKKTEDQVFTFIKQNLFEEPDPFTEPYGPANIGDEIETPCQLFGCLFSEELLSNIAFQTNLYTTQKTGHGHFKPTTPEELKVFLGINILMGLKESPSYKDYWSSLPEMRDTFMSSHMSRDRFRWILSYLHLADNEVQPARGNQNFDKLYKVRLLFDTLSDTFQKYYNPGAFQSIDESMITFKGRSSLKQFMRDKPIKRGYKVWVRADESGYVSEFQIYTGKIANIVEVGLGERVVKDLAQRLKGKNHRVTFDSFFSSVTLLKQLKVEKIYACGTIKQQRKHVPKDFVVDKSLKRGDSDWRMSADGILCIKWMDNRVVHFVSNYHNPETLIFTNRRLKDGSQQQVTCPDVVVDYNAHMGYVDKADFWKSCYAVDRKSKRWWLRIFWHFVDTTVVNAFILFQKRSMGTSMDLKSFRLHVLAGLIGAKQPDDNPRSNGKAINKFKVTVPLERRLDKAAHLPIRGTSLRGANCSTKQKLHRSQWKCSVCQVGLCLSKDRNCFYPYHTR